MPFLRLLRVEALEARCLLSYGEFRGTVWNDMDNDGVRDVAEPVMAGVPVFLDSNSSGRWDSGEPFTTTANDGAYSLTWSVEGLTYTVVETLPAPWQNSYPGWSMSHWMSLDNSHPGGDYGFSVAGAGENILVSEPLDDVQHGVVFLISESDGTVLRTFANPAEVTEDQFGHSLVYLGNRVLVGAPYADAAGPDSGAAYLFNATDGQLLRTFVPPGETGGQMLGYGTSLAINGDYVFLGACQAEGGTGAVYVFSASTGELVRELRSPNPQPGDGFGLSVAVSDDSLVVGAPWADAGAGRTGAVYVFDATRDDPVLTLPGQAAGDEFGYSLAAEGNVIVVGAPKADLGATDSGAAYSFVGNGATPSQILGNPTLDQGDWFGYAVAITGNHVFVGAPMQSVGGSRDDGEVYAFDLDTGGLRQTLVQNHPNPPFGYQFGRTLAIAGSQLVVGLESYAYGATLEGGAFAFPIPEPANARAAHVLRPKPWQIVEKMDFGNYDPTLAPLVTITSLVGSPTHRNPIPVQVAFSKDVAGFTLDDVTVENGTASNLQSADGKTFTLDATPSDYGHVTVRVRTEAVLDQEGNPNAAASLTINYAPAPPQIELSTTYLRSATYLGDNPGTDTFDIWNGGSGTLSWSVAADVPWISCSPSSGSAVGETGAHSTVTVAYSVEGLPYGIYSGTVTVSNRDGVAPPRSILVTMGVAEPYDSSSLGWVGPGVPEVWIDAEDRSMHGPFVYQAKFSPEYAYVNFQVSNPDPDSLGLVVTPDTGHDYGYLMPAVTGDAISLSVQGKGLAPGVDFAAYRIAFSFTALPMGMVVLGVGGEVHVSIDGMWSPEDAGPFRGTVATFPGSLSDPNWRWGPVATARRISPGQWTNYENPGPDSSPWMSADLVVGVIGSTELEANREFIFKALGSGRVALISADNYAALKNDYRLKHLAEQTYVYNAVAGPVTVPYYEYNGGILGLCAGGGEHYRDSAKALNRLATFRSPDSDDDELSDRWEVAYGLDPLNADDAIIDSDDDGLSNLQECQFGTNPLTPDSDGDGLVDGEEIRLECIPLVVDTDADGRIDGVEVSEHTNPLHPDNSERTYYVDAASGNDQWDGLAAQWNGMHGPKATIQAGIDATLDGWNYTVLVGDGLYAGPGNVDLHTDGKSIAIRAARGPESTVIDCRQSGNGINVANDPLDACTIAGFTIRNGSSGIQASGGTVTITDCIISDHYSTAPMKSGILSVNSNTIIEGCLILNNYSDVWGHSGHGVFVLGGSVTIRNSTISGNRAGIDIENAIGLLENCELSRNRAQCNDTIFAAAYIASRADVTLRNCQIFENNGSGVYVADSYLRLEHCVVRDNSCPNQGGGVFVEYSGNTVEIDDSVIIGNKAASGGGVFVAAGGCHLQNSLIVNNSVTGHGGGLMASSRYATATNCVVAGNVADLSGGGVAGSWGVVNSVIWANMAPEGRAVDTLGDPCSFDYCDVQGGLAEVGNAASLARWRGNINVDPLFADPENPVTMARDYHLRSAAGRWDPTDSTWVIDQVTSPCIDAGDPGSDWSAEPEPSGFRINMGAYGGTPEASKSCAPAVNRSPLAANDSYTTQEGVALTISAPGVLQNDHDADGDPLSTLLVSPPRHGQLDLAGDGSFRYTPDEYFSGSDSFLYQLSDGHTTSNIATATITVKTAQATDRSFRAIARTAVGDYPACVALADLNGDQVLDAVVGNMGESTISVLIGEGDGTFQAQTKYSTGPDGCSPYPVVISDLNGDSKLDVVVGNLYVDGIAVFWGNGDGTFHPRTVYACGGGVSSLVVGDFNRDGRPDLALAVRAANEVTVLLQNEDGSFQEGLFYPIAGQPSYSLALGDFNRDGALDLAVASRSGSVSVLLGNGDGTFRPQPTLGIGMECYMVVVGDLNGDGGDDVVTANFNSGDVSVILGHGDGTFEAECRYPVADQLSSVALGDLNGDGVLDIAVAVTSTGMPTGRVSMLLGNRDGTFRAPLSYGVGSRPDSVAVGNLNNDGQIDIVTVNCASNDATVLLNNRAPVAHDDAYTVQEDGRLTVAVPGVLRNDYDSNRDPLTAVLVRGPDRGALDLRADGSFTYVPFANFYGTDTFAYKATGRWLPSSPAEVTITVTPVRHSPVAANDGYTTQEGAVLTIPAPGVLQNDHDADGDPLSTLLVLPPRHGKLDLAGDGAFRYTPDDYFSGSDSFLYQLSDGQMASNMATVTIAVVARQPADWSFRPVECAAVGNYPACVALADLNGDHVLDAVVADMGDAAISVLIGNGDGKFQAQTKYPTGPANCSPYPVAISDLNADGKLDVVVGNLYVNGVAVFWGNGDGTFQPRTVYACGGGVSSLVVGDFNRDGRPDLALAVRAANEVTVLLQNEDGSFQEGLFFSIVGQPSYAIALGDFNRDGALDLAVASRSGSVSVLLGNGNGTFRPQTILGVGMASYIMAVGDLNGDGSDDLVTANFDSGDVSVVLGNSDGTFQAERRYPVADQLTSVALGDLDGDGVLDIAVTAMSPAKACVLLGNGNGTFRAPLSYGVGSRPHSVAVGDLNNDGQIDIVTVNAASNDASVLLNNCAPVAHDDAYTVQEDGRLTVAVPGVLDNDFDVNHDPLNAVLVDPPSHGTLELDANGSFTYVPFASFCGTDTFTYRAYDGSLQSPVATVRVTVTGPPQVVGRYVFYNNSVLDGNSAAFNAQDDQAIATDKAPLLPGNAANFANYTSFSRGINGIMVDVANPAGTAFDASDFSFRVGNGSGPAGAGWSTLATAPTSISSRILTGTNTTRVTIIWPDNTIHNQWLEVTMLAGAGTHSGLAATDVFYFGNAVGETGNNSAEPSPDAIVDVLDEQAIHVHYTGDTPATIDNPYDVNRDGFVDGSDEAIAAASHSEANPLTLMRVFHAGPPDWTDDGLTLLRTGDGMLHLCSTGVIPATDAVAPQVAASVTSVQVTGRDQAVDTLTIDFSGGNPIPMDGLAWDGGLGGSADKLVIQDAAGNRAFTMTETQLSVNGSSVVSYSHTQVFGFDLGAGLLDLGGTTIAVGGMTLVSGNIVHGGLSSAAYAVQSGRIQAELAGTGTLVKTGDGTAILSGANSYSGGTTVQAGTLSIAAAQGLPAGGSLTIGAGGTVVLGSGLSVAAGQAAASAVNDTMIAATATTASNSVALGLIASLATPSVQTISTTSLPTIAPDAFQDNTSAEAKTARVPAIGPFLHPNVLQVKVRDSVLQACTVKPPAGDSAWLSLANQLSNQNPAKKRASAAAAVDDVINRYWR